MILTTTQIKDIIIKQPNKAIINQGVMYNKSLRMHLYGEGLKNSLKIQDGWETSSQFEVRKAYTKSNKDLFVRLGRPIDKVFSARGGTTYYYLDQYEEMAHSLEQRLTKSYSIQEWVKVFWAQHMKDDPFGIMFMEVLQGDEARQAIRSGRSVVYPTYKAITCIHDYCPNGSSLEYVVFKLDNLDKVLSGYETEKRIFRVVDDSYDYHVQQEGEEITILDVVPNVFGQVPALINSDIVSPENENYFLSFFDDVLELATQFLHKGSVQTTHEFLHAYPKYWQYATTCSSCMGTGNNASAKDGKCTSCMGSGVSLALKVSDAIVLNFPEGEDKVVAPDVAGYVTPPTEWYGMIDGKMKLLEDLMNFTLWGSQPKPQVQGPQVDTKGQAKTATQVMNEVKPQADRLQVVSEMAEKRHKFILDAVIRVNLNYPAYPGSSVNYGRRYMVEGPDDILKKYIDARSQGVPYNVLEDLLIEHYEAKYSSDKDALKVALKLMYVEPLIHNSLKEVMEMQGIDMGLKLMKVWYQEWVANTKWPVILGLPVQKLKTNLMEFTIEKMKQYRQVAEFTAAEIKLMPPPKQIAA